MFRNAMRIATVAVCVVAITGCSLLPGRRGNSRFAVRGSSARAPSVGELAPKYGCSAAQIAENWERARLAIARPGTPICSVLGRYGEPVSVTTNRAADMELLSVLHRQPNGRYYNATFVYYADTRVNRQLRRPVGQWVVERVTASR
jgi:hypothetical protein